MIDLLASCSSSARAFARLVLHLPPPVREAWMKLSSEAAGIIFLRKAVDDLRMPLSSRRYTDFWLMPSLTEISATLKKARADGLRESSLMC